MRAGAGILVAGLVAGFVVGAGPAQAAPSQAGPSSAAGSPQILWGTCPAGSPAGFDCGKIDVPLDYDRPNGATITVRLARLPASDPERRQGSLFLNPGGPGGSGIDFVLGAGPELYSDEVRARFDLIGVDPRGIARSEPLLCFDTLVQALRATPPSEFPLTPAEETVVRLRDQQLATACQLRGGPIQDHMSTANVARDLDVLRAAVGDERLNFAGYSYGSFLGVVYANLFPDRVGAVVVDGVLDPLAWTTGRGAQALTQPVSTRLRSDAGAQATLEEFFRLCDAAGPEGCAFAPDASGRYAALAAELRVDPITFGGQVVVSYPNLIGLSLGSMYSSSQ